MGEVDGASICLPRHCSLSFTSRSIAENRPMNVIRIPRNSPLCKESAGSPYSPLTIPSVPDRINRSTIQLKTHVRQLPLCACVLNERNQCPYPFSEAVAAASISSSLPATGGSRKHVEMQMDNPDRDERLFG